MNEEGSLFLSCPHSREDEQDPTLYGLYSLDSKGCDHGSTPVSENYIASWFSYILASMEGWLRIAFHTSYSDSDIAGSPPPFPSRYSDSVSLLIYISRKFPSSVLN